MRDGFRARVLLLAVFQLAVAVVMPVADAAVEIEAARVPLHVESERDVGCIGHDHLFCQLCRTLTLPATAARASGGYVAPPPGPTCDAPASGASFAVGSAPGSALGPRAPPAS